MPIGVFRITDIPADKVDGVVAKYQVDAPLKIERVDQGGGLWTVIATFPGKGDSVESFSE